MKAPLVAASADRDTTIRPYISGFPNQRGEASIPSYPIRMMRLIPSQSLSAR